MKYIDGFVLPVPKKNLQACRRMPQKAGKICREGVSPEWPLDKAQQNKLFFNGFSDSRSVSAGVAANWLQNEDNAEI